MEKWFFRLLISRISSVALDGNLVLGNHSIGSREGEDIGALVVASQAVVVALPSTQRNGRVDVRHAITRKGDGQARDVVVRADCQIARVVVQVESDMRQKGDLVGGGESGYICS